jgi:hypothetical protein
MTAESYPLSWPQGWPRTSDNRRDRTYKFKTSFSRAREQLVDELRRLGASNVVLSSNIPTRLDGLPYADAARKRIDDPGVAVYFTLRQRPMTMARDQYDTVHDNLRSLGLAIEYLRGLERHGGANMLERAFAGFTALPPPEGHAPEERQIDWREELGPFPEGLENPEVLALAEFRYRNKAKSSHADAGGSDEAMIRLNLAIAQARKELS